MVVVSPRYGYSRYTEAYALEFLLSKSSFRLLLLNAGSRARIGDRR